jgi:hypothetical protein
MTGSRKQIAAKCILATVFIFLMVASAHPREDLWQKLNAEILKLSRQGKYPQAIYVAQNSIKLAEKTFGAQGRLEEAELLYTRALAIRRKALAIWEKSWGRKIPMSQPCWRIWQSCTKQPEERGRPMNFKEGRNQSAPG